MDAIDRLAKESYVSLTTFRRNGVPVATPVWIARDGDELLVVTVDNVGKTKRLAHTPRVEITPCDMRGNLAEGAPVFQARAMVRRDPESIARVRRATSSKYLTARLGNLAGFVVDRVKPRAPRAAIVISDVKEIYSEADGARTVN